MQNKWKRSESPSFIPRLLRKRSVSSPPECLSRSPSPIKGNVGSKIPTPTNSRKVSLSKVSTKSNPNLTTLIPLKTDIYIENEDSWLSQNSPPNVAENVFMNDNNLFSMFDNFAQPLEEMEILNSLNSSNGINDVNQNIKKEHLNNHIKIEEKHSISNNTEKTLVPKTDNKQENKKSVYEDKFLDEKYISSSYEGEKLFSKKNDMPTQSGSKDSLFAAMDNNMSLTGSPVKNRVVEEKLFPVSKHVEEKLFVGNNNENDKKPFASNTHEEKENKGEKLNKASIYSSKETVIHHDNKSSLHNEQKTNALYITASLIKKLTKQEDLKKITVLNLSLSKTWNRKIPFIENLDGLCNLTSLNLSNNNIKKIQHIESLVKLTIVNLSDNQITCLNGIESLCNLEHLNVNQNKIISLPNWMCKKLKCLVVLKMANNKIKLVEEIKKLSQLHNLSELETDGNTFSQIPHQEDFVLFYLKTLTLFNGKRVLKTDRENANHRFEQVEINKLEIEIAGLKKNIYEAETSKQSLQNEKEDWFKSNSQLNEKILNLKKNLKIKIEEVDAQKLIINSKSKELSKACEKQYKLEQELAFHKLDAKFDEFWIPNELDTEQQEDSLDKQESTYIGKASYKRNNISKENIVLNNEQMTRFLSFLQRLNPQELKQNEKLMAVLKDLLDCDFGKKQTSKTDTENNKLEGSPIDLDNDLLKLKEENTRLMKLNDTLSKDNNQFDQQNKNLKGLLERNERNSSEIEKAIEAKSIAFDLIKTDNLSLQNQIKFLEEENSNLSIFEENCEAKMHEIEQLNQEIDHLKISLDWKSTDLHKCLEFVKRATQYLMQGGVLNNPDTLHDKPLQAALSNLRNYLKDLKNVSLDIKDTVKDLNEERNKLLNELRNLEEDNENAKITIKQLKDELDMKDSMERVMKHEIHGLKAAQTKSVEPSLQEYDEICQDMKKQMELMIKKNSKLKKDVNKLKHAYDEERCMRKEIESNLTKNMQLYDSTINQLNDQFAEIKEDNSDLLRKLDISTKDVFYWKEETNKIKTQAQKMLDQEGIKYEEDMGKIFDDIQQTKSYINQLKQDYEEELGKAYGLANTLKKSFKEIEDKLKSLLNKQKHHDEVVIEIQTVKQMMQKLTDNFEKLKVPIDSTYLNLLKNIDDLAEKIESKEAEQLEIHLDSKHHESSNQTLDVLMASLEQIVQLKQRLQENNEQSTNIPEKLIEGQSNVMNSLLQKLNEKEKELHRLRHQFQYSGNIQIDNKTNIQSPPSPSIPSGLYDLAEPSTPRRRVSFDEPTNQADSNASYHHHYINNHNESAKNSIDQLSANPNVLVCNIKEHMKHNQKTEKFISEDIDDHMMKLTQSGDHLKWELNRLETKIGDVLLRKSISRQSRYDKYIPT